MEEGQLESLYFPVEKLPTEQLQRMAGVIHKSLDRGRRGVEVYAEHAGNEETRQQLHGIQQELADHNAKGKTPNIHKLKSELHEFHIAKQKQLLAWSLQAAIDEGKDIADLLASLSKLEEEAGENEPLRKRAYALRFDPAAQPPPDEICLSIGDYPIGARGNLSAAQGKSKVGKTAVVAALLASAQRGSYSAQGDTLCIDWKGKGDGAIVHFDTEQSPADFHGLVSRSVTRSGLPEVSDRLVSIPLVRFARSERLQILEDTLRHEQEARGSIDLVVLDGVADLCASPNDEGESLELVSRLLSLAHRYSCPIFVILHENPSTDAGKTRGHLGSELNRKAFANLRIDKDPSTGVSTIYGTDMRKRDIPQNQGFCFAWDNAAGMHAYKGRAAGLKAAQADEKKAAKEREVFSPIYEYAENGTKTACPVLSPADVAEIDRDINGTGNTKTEAAWKKQMQRAEGLGVLRKSGRGAWGLNQTGQTGQQRDKDTLSR
tara:strand:- start:58 stop:1527 length:1470 start_codon:yes stop_codon:yes gene_type:complete